MDVIGRDDKGDARKWDGVRSLQGIHGVDLSFSDRQEKMVIALRGEDRKMIETLLLQRRVICRSIR